MKKFFKEHFKDWAFGVGILGATLIVTLVLLYGLEKIF